MHFQWEKMFFTDTTRQTISFTSKAFEKDYYTTTFWDDDSDTRWAYYRDYHFDPKQFQVGEKKDDKKKNLAFTLVHERAHLLQKPSPGTVLWNYQVARLLARFLRIFPDAFKGDPLLQKAYAEISKEFENLLRQIEKREQTLLESSAEFYAIDVMASQIRNPKLIKDKK